MPVLDVDLMVAEDLTEPFALDAAELERLGLLVLGHEGVERPCSVSVSVVTDDAIAEINEQWREQARPTDVVSLECERPDDPDLAPGEPCELGDIILAPAYIAVQAKRFGTTPADETRLLAIHGLLHLLGYDHIEEADAVVMESLEDALLAEATAGRLDAVATTRHEELQMQAVEGSDGA